MLEDFHTVIQYLSIYNVDITLAGLNVAMWLYNFRYHCVCVCLSSLNLSCIWWSTGLRWLMRVILDLWTRWQSSWRSFTCKWRETSYHPHSQLLHMVLLSLPIVTGEIYRGVQGVIPQGVQGVISTGVQGADPGRQIHRGSRGQNPPTLLLRLASIVDGKSLGHWWHQPM